MIRNLLIASKNPGKIREITAILSSLDVQILSSLDFPGMIEVEEIGTTYAENARLKAQTYLDAVGLPVLADDSGLEMDALNGAPGIFSARYSQIEAASDKDRRQYLLQQLAGKSKPWHAHFHCTAVLALPYAGIFTTEGRCDGFIIPEERGQGGFGYDPIFFIPEFNATMAELPPAVKNEISHRAKALRAMIPLIQKA